MRLRSVDLRCPNPGASREFLERTWGVIAAGSTGGADYYRGTNDHPYILSLRAAATTSVDAITFAGPPDEVEALLGRAKAAGALASTFAALDAPGGGAGGIVNGPEGQRYRFVVETAKPELLPPSPDRPLQITHAVMNAHDVAACERFAVDVLGFRVSDRTRAMTFIRANRQHHAVAYAHAQIASLNHIAFEMRDLESVMRGIGRLRDAGVPAVWGPGRHGPGNNVFGYFVAPFGCVIEYTSEVGLVGDDYKVGGPEDWKWPPGRIDHWGVSKKDMDQIGPAEARFRFEAA